MPPEETNNPINDLIQAVDENTTETNTILEHSLEQGVRTGKIVEAQLETADKTYSEIKKMSDKKMAIEIEIDGAETIMYKGEKGDKGDKGDTPSDEVLKKLIKPLIPEPIKGEDGRTPTEEEIMSLIEPLIPEPIKGEDGSNYILSDQDKQDIADSIEVPVVEKVIEKTQVIKEVVKKEKPEELKKKIESLGIDYEKLSNTPDIESMMNVVRKTSSKTVSLVELDDVDLSGVTITNGKYVLGSGGGGGTVGPGTTNEIAYFNAPTTITSLTTATYPSLTELAYVKGVTSAIQTQLNAKQDLLSGTGFVKSSAGVISYDTSTYLTTSSASTTYVPYSGATADVMLGSQALQFGGSYRTTITYDNANEATLILSDNLATNGKIGFGAYNGGYRVYTQGTNINATRTIEFPNASGTFVLSVNGTTPDTAGNVVIASGALTVGSTAIASGTTTRILYDNGGTLGEYTLTGTGTVVAMQTAPSFLNGITAADTVLAGSGSLAGSVINSTQTWNTTGAPTAIKLNVTNTASGAAALLMDLQVGGVSHFKVDKIGSITMIGSVSAFNGVFGGLVRVAAASKIQWASSTNMGGATDGKLLLTNNANTDFTAIQLGGTTSSFPSIKRSGTTIAFRLADDSADAPITVSNINVSGSMYLNADNKARISGNTNGVFDFNYNTSGTGGLNFWGGGTTAVWTVDYQGNQYTAGTLDLGHATDTTLSRVSAGVIAVEGVTIPSISSTNTLTNKRITKRVTAITSSATPTINTDNCDAVDITALATAITSMTTNLSGTPANKDTLVFQIKDDGTARAITWGASFVAGGVALPTTTVISKILTVGFIYNTANALNKWMCIASAQEA